ncbi:histone-like nucleoid-structuring protein Lsr2 [Gordonia sp. WA4-43]|uniref:Lsr2 family DNA-binding protein n=1 Tax=Gordonia sp. WA4-43 TaxID=2878678 RepID=UPI00299F1AE1|nr:histone-like nucleoid-structuring protein Lsr2 [Gordonia sp. WA4-43]
MALELPGPAIGDLPIGRDGVSREKIRTWARAQGYEVGNRGRIAAEIAAAYHRTVG